MWEMASRTSISILASAATTSSEEVAFFWDSARRDLTVSREKSSGAKASTALMARVDPSETLAKPPETKNFLELPEDSITSTRPGRSCWMVGTWSARIPRSPVVVGTLTWTLRRGVRGWSLIGGKKKLWLTHRSSRKESRKEGREKVSICRQGQPRRNHGEPCR